jgi:hypothetical protein
MPIQAVITADIVHFTSLPTAKQKKLLHNIQLLLAPYQHEFYRGDSFQVFFKNATAALQTALLCRCVAIVITQADNISIADVRVSIGIAPAKTPTKSLGASNGDAFVLSGRAFDSISNSQQRLAIACQSPIAAEGLQVIADYCNAIFKTMTGKQAAVIFELLLGKSQLEVAKKIKKSKSTVSQHVSAGRWVEIEKLLINYNNIVNQL